MDSTWNDRSSRDEVSFWRGNGLRNTWATGDFTSRWRDADSDDTGGNSHSTSTSTSARRARAWNSNSQQQQTAEKTMWWPRRRWWSTIHPKGILRKRKWLANSTITQTFSKRFFPDLLDEDDKFIDTDQIIIAQKLQERKNDISVTMKSFIDDIQSSSACSCCRNLTPPDHGDDLSRRRPSCQWISFESIDVWRSMRTCQPRDVSFNGSRLSSTLGNWIVRIMKINVDAHRILTIKCTCWGPRLERLGLHHFLFGRPTDFCLPPPRCTQVPWYHCQSAVCVIVDSDNFMVEFRAAPELCISSQEYNWKKTLSAVSITTETSCWVTPVMMTLTLLTVTSLSPVTHPLPTSRSSSKSSTYPRRHRCTMTLFRGIHSRNHHLATHPEDCTGEHCCCRCLARHRLDEPRAHVHQWRSRELGRLGCLLLRAVEGSACRMRLTTVTILLRSTGPSACCACWIDICVVPSGHNRQKSSPSQKSSPDCCEAIRLCTTDAPSRILSLFFLNTLRLRVTRMMISGSMDVTNLSTCGTVCGQSPYKHSFNFFGNVIGNELPFFRDLCLTHARSTPLVQWISTHSCHWSLSLHHHI